MKSNTKNLAVIIAIVTALVVAGLLFLVAGVQKPSLLQQQAPATQETPVQTEEEQELQSIDAGNPDDDFSDLKEDLSEL